PELIGPDLREMCVDAAVAERVGDPAGTVLLHRTKICAIGDCPCTIAGLRGRDCLVTRARLPGLPSAPPGSPVCGDLVRRSVAAWFAGLPSPARPGPTRRPGARARRRRSLPLAAHPRPPAGNARRP